MLIVPAADAGAAWSGAVASALTGWLLSGVLWPGTVWSLILVMALACAGAVTFGTIARRLERRGEEAWTG